MCNFDSQILRYAFCLLQMRSLTDRGKGIGQTIHMSIPQQPCRMAYLQGVGHDGRVPAEGRANHDHRDGGQQLS